jgi:hypothetical protein
MATRLVHNLIQGVRDNERELDVGRVAGNPLRHAPKSLHIGFDGADEEEEQAEKPDHGNYHNRPDSQRNLPEQDFFSGLG